MTQRTLHERLSDLHAELLAARSADPATQDHLQHLADHIGTVIERRPQSPTAEAYGGLQARLTQAAVAFETSHPQLSKTLETLIDTLGQHTL
jgi:Domain of unknown function (DUF4404)